MNTFLAAFKTRETADAAVDQLIADGVPAGDVTILNRDGDLAGQDEGDRVLGFPVVAGRGVGLPVGSFALFADREGLRREDISYYSDQAEAGAFVVAVKADSAKAANVKSTLMSAGAQGDVWEKPAA